MVILAYTLSGLSLLMSALFLIKPKVTIGFLLIWLPLIAGALSPLWVIIGVAGAIIGWINMDIWSILMGTAGAGTMTLYIWRCTRDHGGFEKAFGANWSDRIQPQQAKCMLKRRWTLYLKMNTFPEPNWERDIPFWKIPGTERQLLCDIWRPANGNVSGLAFIYLHGSGWAALDKDFGTRPFFRHLVAQGHTVMDVAYRLLPEVDIYGMVGDAKRAVTWIKTNAVRYGLNPEMVVIGGGSAGAHIAMLAGYTPGNPDLTPGDLINRDTSVAGIISYYGPADIEAGYRHYNIKKFPPVQFGVKVEGKNAFMNAGRTDILLGGHPDDVPEMYALANPGTHVNQGSPPTLLIQGNMDFLVPLEGTNILFAKLIEKGVPAIKVIFPWTEHAFDLLLPQFSPPAQSALYDVDRFLALMQSKVLVS